MITSGAIKRKEPDICSMSVRDAMEGGGRLMTHDEFHRPGEFIARCDYCGYNAMCIEIADGTAACVVCYPEDE
jgi:hypothetical protein